MKNQTVSAFALSLLLLPAFGCSKDADPNAKIDDPGYYNGDRLPKAKPEEPSQGIRRAHAGVSADD